MRSVVLGMLAYGLMAAAQEQGNWRAASSTAKSITGDLSLSERRIVIDFTAFPMAQIRTLEPAEVSAVFDVDNPAAGAGALYKLEVPAEKKFQHKNSLCGSEDTEWMVAYAAGKTLQVVFFSGQRPPVLTFDAITKSSNVCGTFSYVK